MSENGNGWNEWKNAVLQEQKQQSEAIKELTKKVEGFIVAQSVIVTEIKIKSGLWGFLAGSVPSAIAGLIYLTKILGMKP